MNKKNPSRPERRRVLELIAAAGITSGISQASTTSEDSDEVVPFDDLTAAAQSSFRRALDSGLYETTYAELPEQLRTFDLVEFDGDTYSLNRQTWAEASNTIRPAQIDSADVTERYGVVESSELADEARGVFRQALSEGKLESSDPFLPDFDDCRYVVVNSQSPVPNGVYDLNPRPGDRRFASIEPSKT